MKTIVDLHIHSKYSRATSKALDVSGIAKFAAIKGVDVIATGDITHPKWIEEIEEGMEEDGSGFLRLKDGGAGAGADTRFVLCGEVANIYKKGDRARRMHTLFVLPSIESVKKVNKKLEDEGYNIRSDGRPIIGLDVKELAKIYLDIEPRALVIPAHIWTPWFSLYGSKSGFDSIDECWEEMSEYIWAVETGLSSDPAMNWRVSDLNDKMILSHSDAHSPEKIGREADVFEWDEVSYDTLYESIKENKNLEYTIEFFPEEGKYHMDGHRKCEVRLEPKETAKHKGVCPKCDTKLVVGVMNRVEELADQEATPDRRAPFKSIIPLPEIIANAFGCGVKTKRVDAEFTKIIEALGSEFHILLDADPEEISRVADPLVAEGIKRVRAGNVHIEPGYDGEFGVIEVFTDKERASHKPQQEGLFE
ncbi:endonuclease Q family protein [Patescibacteria group bacterium]